MTDFMRWLYAHYILPSLRAADRSGYGEAISSLENDLAGDRRTDYDLALEFYAGEAFLLGLRTGAGLGSAICPPPSDR